MIARRLRHEKLETRQLLASDLAVEIVPIPQTIAPTGRIEFVADINNDGQVEFFVDGAFDDVVSWFQLNDDGFAEFADHLEPQQAKPVFPADFDNDGDLDLLVKLLEDVGAPDFYASLYLLENLDGQGTFSQPRNLIADSVETDAFQFRVADFDSDGDVDFTFVTHFQGSVFKQRWAENQFPLRKFTHNTLCFEWVCDPVAEISADSPGESFIPTYLHHSESLSADIDGDGDNDTFYAGSKSIQWNEYEGLEFTTHTIPIPVREREHFGVLALDIDSDGDIDFVTQSERAVYVVENTDGQATEFSIRELDLPAAPLQDQWNSGLIVGSLYPVDFDNDGDPDFVDSNINGRIAWYENQQSGTEFVKHEIGIYQTDQLLDVFDANGDGVEDVIGKDGWYQAKNDLTRFSNHSTVTLRRAILNASGDVDSDDTTDLVAVTTNGTRQFLEWKPNSQGDFSQSIPLAEVKDVTYLELVDVNSDGLSDIVTVEENQLRWRTNRGDGEFDAPVNLRDVADQSIQGFADFDSDGDDDVLIGNENGSRWIENVDATFSEEHVFSDRQPFQTVFGDIDADGDIDVVQAFTVLKNERPHSFELQQFTNSGSGLFVADENRRQSPEIPELRHGWRNAYLNSLQLATIDDSGLLDIVVSYDHENNNIFKTYHHGRVAWFANDQTLGLQPEQLLLESSLTGIEIATGNLDGDPHTEIVTSRGIVDGMYVIDFSKAGDLNQDGKLDVDDINRICSAIRHGENDSRFDLNEDMLVDDDDLDQLLHVTFNSRVGDVNLDAVFDSSDLVLLFQTGIYEDDIVGNATWQTGDWNCDGEFTSADLVKAFRFGDQG